MDGQFGCWRRDLSLRHAEILLALAVFPDGRSAPELAGDLYGDQSRVVTVRAELSRMRKQYVGLLAAQPYRIAASVDIEVQYPGDDDGAAAVLDRAVRRRRPRQQLCATRPLDADRRRDRPPRQHLRKVAAVVGVGIAVAVMGSVPSAACSAAARINSGLAA